MQKTPSFLRAAGWISPVEFEDVEIAVVGCGAVGSNFALLLAKMGATKFLLVDGDTVEDHNLPNQAYDTRHIGEKKVDALEAVLKEFNPEVQVSKVDRYISSEDKDLFSNTEYMLLSVDSMKARKELGSILESLSKLQFALDIRLGFTHGELYVIDPLETESVSQWMRTLLPDEQVPEGPCNLRMCSTLVYAVISQAVQFVCIAVHEDKRNKKTLYLGDDFPRKIVFSLENTLETYSFGNKN